MKAVSLVQLSTAFGQIDYWKVPFHSMVIQHELQQKTGKIWQAYVEPYQK
jgi:hypothetical protein